MADGPISDPNASHLQFINRAIVQMCSSARAMVERKARVGENGVEVLFGLQPPALSILRREGAFKAPIIQGCNRAGVHTCKNGATSPEVVESWEYPFIPISTRSISNSYELNGVKPALPVAKPCSSV